jgi:hypothetical protein
MLLCFTADAGAVRLTLDIDEHKITVMMDGMAERVCTG